MDTDFIPEVVALVPNPDKTDSHVLLLNLPCW